MSIGWFIIEIFINIVEVCTVFYLLCNKFSKKYRTFLPTLLFMIGNTVYLSLPLFISSEYLLPVEIIMIISCFIYVLLFREGSIWKKIFWVSLSYALIAVIAILTTTLISIFTGIPSLDLITQSSGGRLVMVMIVKIIQVIIFYILSLKKKKIELLYSSSLIICFIIPLISFLSMVIMYYILLKDTTYSIPDNLLYLISVSYLIINIIIFVLYEIINKEAEKNYILMANQKQYEITEQHNNEILKIYSDMREWRHDYANHMQLIMSFLEKSEMKDENISEAINYIQSLDEKIKLASLTVSTGNYIVDAIVSAKLALASTFNIKFEYDIILPDKLTITDTDLCAILSNLLDNAIEACYKLDNGRYIKLEIIIIRNQLYIKLINSTNGKYIKENGRFKTTKQGQLHGIGMKHIESIVVEYSGTYNINAESTLFTTQISIPLARK